MANDMLDINTSVTEQTLTLVVGQDQENQRPRLYALIRSTLKAIKLYEQVQRSVFFGVTYELSVARQRDNWGRLLQVIRGGLDEAEYRLYQDLQVYVNTVHDSIPRMLELLRRQFDPKAVEAFPMFPNGAKFWVRGGTFVSEAIRAASIKLYRAYQPRGHTWPVIECPERPWTFDQVIDEAEPGSMCQTIFGGV